MTPEELDGIEKALEGLTPGPWGHVYRLGDPASCGSIYGQDPDRPKIGYTVQVACFEAFSAKNKDANFMANSRQWVPSLVARVRELEAELSVNRVFVEDAQKILVNTVAASVDAAIRVEREACAKIAEKRHEESCPVEFRPGGKCECAARLTAEAIRARRGL